MKLSHIAVLCAFIVTATLGAGAIAMHAEKLTAEQVGAVLAALPAGGAITDTVPREQTNPMLMVPMDMTSPQMPAGESKEKKEECTEGVECDSGKGEQKAFRCPSNNPQEQAGCQKQKALADKQVSVGVGGAQKPAMQVTYSPTQCNVWSSLGSGTCNPNASRQCPTVQAYEGGGGCFWSECPNQCGGGEVEKPKEPVVTDPAGHPCSQAATALLALSDAELAHHPCVTDIGAAGDQVAAAPGTSGVKYPVTGELTSGLMPATPVKGDLTSGVKPAPGPAQSGYSTGGNLTTSMMPVVASPGSRVPVSSYNPNSRITPGSTPLAHNAGSQYTGPVTSQSPYRSFQNPNTLQQPQSFIQRFAGGGSVVDRLANFVTGQAALRTSPEGLAGGGPQVVYVTPNFATPEVERQNRSIEQIASDIAATTPQTLARVDHFALTLESVGGPSAVNTENESYGRIQDLIVEDEAIRALRVAEEEGRRARNAVFCRPNEAAEGCQQRREVKAQEVERRVFVEELQKRVLPDTAIQHFLAVYDGWVRPSPVPATRATSTLGALAEQEQNPFAEYEVTTSGDNFVVWFMESVADATIEAVTAFTNLITGNTGAGSEVSE